MSKRSQSVTPYRSPVTNRVQRWLDNTTTPKRRKLYVNDNGQMFGEKQDISDTQGTKGKKIEKNNKTKNVTTKRTDARKATENVVETRKNTRIAAQKDTVVTDQRPDTGCKKIPVVRKDAVHATYQNKKGEKHPTAQKKKDTGQVMQTIRQHLNDGEGKRQQYISRASHAIERKKVCVQLILFLYKLRKNRHMYAFLLWLNIPMRDIRIKTYIGDLDRSLILNYKFSFQIRFWQGAPCYQQSDVFLWDSTVWSVIKVSFFLIETFFLISFARTCLIVW